MTVNDKVALHVGHMTLQLIHQEAQLEQVAAERDALAKQLSERDQEPQE